MSQAPSNDPVAPWPRASWKLVRGCFGNLALGTECDLFGSVLGQERCLAALLPVSVVFQGWLPLLGTFIFVSVWEIRCGRQHRLTLMVAFKCHLLYKHPH